MYTQATQQNMTYTARPHRNVVSANRALTVRIELAWSHRNIMLAEIANSGVSLTLQSRTEANSTANVSTIP